MRISPFAPILLCVPFLLLGALAQAQSSFPNYSAVTQIYRLSDAEASALYSAEKPPVFQESWLHTLVDTFYGAVPRRALPAGHYLLAEAVEERVELELRFIGSLRVWLLPDSKDFKLTVTDSTGQAIRDARVLLRGTPAPFDTLLQCYHLKKRSKNGFVQVYAAGESWFGQLENTLRKPLWLRWLDYRSSRGAARVIAFPVRLIFQTSKRFISWVRGYGFGRSGRYRYHSRDFAGYIALNQPKYQPGDTLRVKAYVADRKGKPWKKPLELDLREQSGQYREVLQRDVKPTTPGAFLFEMPLSDTLALDMPYSLTFTEKTDNPNRNEREIGTAFRLEDYQLDEIAYTLEPTQPEFRRGEPVTLHLSARDANNLAAPDAAVKLVLTTESATDFYAPEVWVPDTLWQHGQAFSPEGELSLVVPDSVWPQATLKVRAQAYCTTSSGELQEKTVSFSVFRQPNPLRTRVESGYLIVERLRNRNMPDSVLFMETPGSDREPQIRRVALPFRTRLSPGVSHYGVKSEEEALDIPLPEAEKAVRNEAWQTNDSVYFILQNPHRMAVQYQIWEGLRPLREGSISDSVWVWQSPATKGKSYRMSYRFIWAGLARQFQTEAPFYSALLQINLEQPETVQPGQQVQVKIRVENARQQPVSSVNLTAGAYNSQFKDTPYEAPDISYKPLRQPFAWNKFQLNKAVSPAIAAPVTRDWYGRLGLDSLLYYRLRFRGDGWYTESIPVREQHPERSLNQPEGPAYGLPFASDSFYRYRPQFAPYIIRGNEAQPVYLIYCNNLLVYYYGAANWQRYSFYGGYGYNQIRVRTRDGEYVLDSVRLEAGQKLELALDADRYHDAQTPFKVHFIRRPDTLTAFEQQTLRNTMLLRRAEGSASIQYFWNGPDNIQAVLKQNGFGVQAFGPFYPKQTLYYLDPGNFLTSFLFEPGFEYSIAPGRERLYESRWPRGNARLPKAIAAHGAGELAWGSHHISLQAPRAQKAPAFKTAGPDLRGRAALKLRLEQADTLLAVALTGDSLQGPFLPETRFFANLRPGAYRLRLFGRNNTVWTRDIQLKRDSILLLDLRAILFRPADPTEVLDQIFAQAELGSAPKQTKPAPASPFTQWPGAVAGGNGIRGKLSDADGEALIGALVMVFQNQTLVGSAITDIDGNYQIFLPRGAYDLRFQYTGYATAEVTGMTVKGYGLEILDQKLEAGSLLNEVVVTAYSVGLVQKDATRSYSTADIRNMPTRNVNAIIATTAGSVDIGLDSMTVMGVLGKRSWYGELDGVTAGIVSIGYSDEPDAKNRKRKVPVPELDGAGTPDLRTQFRDYAYWQPNLLTDQNGEAWFQAAFPDNITSWNSFVLGMDRRKRAGVATLQTRAFKPLLAKLALPRFAVAGDSFDAAGLTTNLGKDSVDIHTMFHLNDRLLRENRTRIGSGLAEFTAVQVPAGDADSLHLSYGMESGTNSDGEKRSIAILPVGARETSGQFLLLERDTAFQLNFDPALGAVTVQAQDNALDLLLEDIDYLRNYTYGCNEQTASRLLALLAEKQIAAVPQTIRKQNEKTAAREAEKREKDIRTCLKRLQDGRLADGSWGWWVGGTPNAWMTTYVLRALLAAKQAGYACSGCDQALTWLRHATPGLPPFEQREALLLLREFEVNFDCAPFLNRLDTVSRITLYDRLSYWRLQQLCGRNLAPDSLRHILKPTTTGGLYCGEESTHWFERRDNTLLLAYDLAQTAGWKDMASGIRRYWLESRRAAQPRNTVETAQILRRLLPELLAGTDTLRRNVLEINGLKSDTLPRKWIFPVGIQSVSVRKSGSGPVYFNAYQQWQNADPAPRSDLFDVKTQLEQGGLPVDSLKQGEPAELIVRIQVNQKAEYVMLEVPIPAGCSYGEKQPGQIPEVHREYFRDRTALFFESLPVGKYEFRVPLEPRFTGRFTLNPARMEQMYFPVFYGRNGVKQVRIGK